MNTYDQQANEPPHRDGSEKRPVGELSARDDSPRPKAGRKNALTTRINSGWFLFLFYTLFFSFFGGIGWIWGSLVALPNPPMRDLPLYPNAQAVTDLKGEPIEVPHTLPTEGTGSFTNFKFQTTDPPNDVIRFYSNALRKIYGYQAINTDLARADTSSLQGIREKLRNGWIREEVSVSATRDSSGLTRVEVTLRLSPGR
jgi:hypothetical protein